MRIEDYPPQEPFTKIGETYHAEVLRRGAGVIAVDVQHGKDPYQSLAVYAAEKPTGDVFAVLHGGGWTNGYKEWMAFMAPAYTAQGITFVSLGYRLAPQHVFPAGVEDAMDGIAWIYRRIADHGGDPARIFIGGHSAGGHMAALLALRTDWQDRRALPRTVIRGALPISGTYLFGPDSGLAMRPRFLGPEGRGTEKAASPLSHVHAGAPPFLIAHGSADFPHLIRQSDEFRERLAGVGVNVGVLVLDRCNHLEASYASGDPKNPYVGSAIAWIQALGEPGPSARDQYD